ncbi:MAG: glycosyltransferase family 4 protein [Bacteroidetes bacterium]|nr:glycosyltransferase family 4 protein [Bacteroidota bacterium]MCB9227368.1 glycosyltransferase family 4 protein [Chitinophagales bacterium]
MRILFLTDNFPPEVNAPASRTYEHCKEWVKKGAEVTVITCFPNFPTGKVYNGYKNKLYLKEEIDGIKIIRVFTYITANKGTIKRTLDYISFMLAALIAGLFVKTDFIVATSPQFFTAIAGRLLSLVKKKEWLLEIRDIWPESIKVVTGMDGFIIRFFEFLEKRMYKTADKIVIVTPELKNNLIKKHPYTVGKIKVITNGVEISKFNPNYVDSELKKNLGLEQKFVILYIGTHGMAHGLDFILKAVQKVKDKEIHFLFVGDGAKKQELLELNKKLNLGNVTMLPSVLKNEVINYISVSDVGLVNLVKSDLFKAAIPSKIFEIAAMQKPILLGVEGEVQKIIEKYNAGVAFEPENEGDFLEKLAQIKTDYQNYKQGANELAKTYDRKKLALDMLEFIEE